MCGKIKVSKSSLKKVVERFHPKVHGKVEEGTFIAGSMTPTLIQEKDSYHLGPLMWGLKKNGDLIKNARAESLMEKPTWRGTFEEGYRCVVPIDGFFEKNWERRQEIKFHFPDETPLFLGGLWFRNQTIVIITTEPHPVVKPIHDRMPLTFNFPEAIQWLEPRSDLDLVYQMIKPYEGQIKSLNL